MTIFTIRFSAGPWAGEQMAWRDEDGTVRLWDEVAGHYTRPRTLSESQRARLARAADSAHARMSERRLGVAP